MLAQATRATLGREQAIPKAAGRGNWENKSKAWLGEVSVHVAYLDVHRACVAGKGEALEEQHHSYEQSHNQALRPHFIKLKISLS